MVLITFSVLLAFVSTAAIVHRHRLRRRWVSPYSGFRAAGARVTRTGQRPFRVAGAQQLGPEGFPTA